jgi:hypothetical protein
MRNRNYIVCWKVSHAEIKTCETVYGSTNCPFMSFRKSGFAMDHYDYK